LRKKYANIFAYKINVNYFCVKLTQMVLNLDGQFKPFINKSEIEFEHFTFPGGEPHIKILSNLKSEKEVVITQRIRSFNNIGLLLLAVNALKNMGIKSLNLFLPYLPGARQDRLMTDGEPLTVKVYANLINAQNFKSVTIFDPHSEVTSALLNNCTVINNHNFIKKIVDHINTELLLISPDGGALKKIYKVAKHLQNYEVVECSKTRDVKTGALSGFKAYSNDLQGKDCLIIDDICDGGGTFLGLAKELKSKNSGKLYLAVSHGIFSKGFDELNAFYEKIFTTDSFQTLNNTTKLEQINISQILK